MIYRKLDADNNLVRIGEKYYLVNDYTLDLLISYRTTQDINALSLKLGCSENEINEIYHELNDAFKNADYELSSLNLDIPIKVHWRITDKCNLRCKHCYLGEKTNIELQDSELLKIADDISNSGIMEVTLTGGEPFSVKILGSIVQKFISRNILVNIFTNATLYEHICEFINATNDPQNVRFYISVDGLKENHEKMRGKNTYFQTIKAIKLLTEKGYTVITNTTLTSNNYLEIPDIIIQMQSLGVKVAQISNLVNMGWANDNNDLCMDKEKNKVFENNMRNLTDKNLNIKFLYSPFPSDPNDVRPDVYEISQGKIKKVGSDTWKCCAGVGKVTITNSGDVLCCPFMNEYVLGNIKKNSLYEIWNSPNREKFNKYLNYINGRNRFCAVLKEL